MDDPKHTGATHQRAREDLAMIAEVLHCRLGGPLAALRATLDTLARRPGRGSEASFTRAALAQVVDLGRMVGDLVDFAEPRPLQPMRCSLDEIVRGALETLHADLRPRVLLAVENRHERLVVDGPILSRCLAHLVSEGLETGGECMLRVRGNGDETRFIILHAPGVRAGSAYRSLRRSIALRDVQRMGGTITFLSSDDHSTSVVQGIAGDERKEAAA